MVRVTDITILATTWLPPGNEDIRLSTFVSCMTSWQYLLNYEHAIHLHVADDGTEQPHWQEMSELISRGWERGRVTFSRQERRGVGSSLNAGLIRCWGNSHLVLHAVDDWELLSELDLEPWVKFSQDLVYNAEMIRFFGHPDLTGTFKHIPPHGWAIEIDKHHYFFSFRPVLWHKRFFDRVGYFREDVSALECEDDFNTRLKNLSGPSGVWLALPELWRHLDPVSLSGVKP